MKKVLVLTVIAILALGVMALADHVSGTAGGASASVTVNGTIEVYQWFDYSVSPTGAQTISDYNDSYWLELVGAQVSSNATLSIKYTLLSHSDILPTDMANDAHLAYGPSKTTITDVNDHTASFNILPSADPNNMTDVSLWLYTGTIPYDLQAQTMTFTIKVEFNATVTF